MADNINFKDSASEIKAILKSLDNLTDRQLEIVEKMLISEKEIGELRLGYLNKFIDKFSTALDTVIARKTSELSDSFLVFDELATKTLKNVTKTKEAADSTKTEFAATIEKYNTGTKKTNEKTTEKPQPKSYDIVDDETLDKIKKLTEDDIAGTLTQIDELFKAEESSRRKMLTDEEAYKEKFNKRYTESVEKDLNELSKKGNSMLSSIMDVEIARLKREGYENKDDAYNLNNEISALKLSDQEATYSELLNVENKLNQLTAVQEYYSQTATNDKGELVSDAGNARSELVNKKDQLKLYQELESERIKFIEAEELKSKRKNNGILEAEESARILKAAAEQYGATEKNMELLRKKQMSLDKKRFEELQKQRKKELQERNNVIFGKGHTITERVQAAKEQSQDDNEETNWGKAISATLVAVSDLAKQLNKQIDEIASKKGVIDTRLQGSSNETHFGSYWDSLVQSMTSVGAITPYFKQENFANNIETLVNKGISFDLEQRAFLMTIQEKIANTFDVADSSLLRLVRIQQEDSTAGRLGMESALNSFLNHMYETSEYLNSVADSVRGSLLEMQSLMQGADAAEVEFQVQKWLGSLYSVGMSDSAVNAISDALGKIAAGQIEGLTNGGAGNLLVMAANDAGISIADVLTRGIDAEETNELLQASVNYLAELADSAKDNKVVQQQLANVFGVKASDLKAATNLVLPGSTTAIAGHNLMYGDMISRLYEMANTMGNRTSLAEMMTNIWGNAQYSIAGSMASNPISYFIYKLATVVDDVAGGMPLPFVNVLGSGIDLNTSVSDLMRVASVGIGIFDSFGEIMSGLGSSFSGTSMLNKLGFNNDSGLVVTPRGDGSNLLSGGSTGGGQRTITESGYVGNASGSDIKDSTIQEAEDSKKAQMIEAKEQESTNTLDTINTTVLKIYELLDNVTNGDKSLRVKIDDYGLTKPSGSSAMTGVNSMGLGGSVNLGGF